MNQLIELATALQSMHEREPPALHGNLHSVCLAAYIFSLLKRSPSSSQVIRIGQFDPVAFTALAGQDTNVFASSRWTAPELLQIDENVVRTTSADVFAFGMKIVEVSSVLHIPSRRLIVKKKVVTERLPFSSINFDGSVLIEIARGQRPDRPAGIPDGLWRIAQVCWKHDPLLRPSMREVKEMLLAVQTE